MDDIFDILHRMGTVRVAGWRDMTGSPDTGEKYEVFVLTGNVSRDDIEKLAARVPLYSALSSHLEKAGDKYVLAHPDSVDGGTEMIRQTLDCMTKEGLPPFPPVIIPYVYRLLGKEGKDNYESLKTGWKAEVTQEFVDRMKTALSEFATREDSVWIYHHPRSGSGLGKPFGEYSGNAANKLKGIFGENLVLKAYPRIHIVVSSDPDEEFYTGVFNAVNRWREVIPFIKYYRDSGRLKRRRGGIHINFSTSEGWEEIYNDFVRLGEGRESVSIEADIYFYAYYRIDHADGREILVPLFPISYTQMLSMESVYGNTRNLMETAMNWLGLEDRDRLYRPGGNTGMGRA